jgi:hypothetical protein
MFGAAKLRSQELEQVRDARLASVLPPQHSRVKNTPTWRSPKPKLLVFGAFDWETPLLVRICADMHSLCLAGDTVL